MPTIWTLCIYVGKDVRIRGYFSAPRAVRQQNNLGEHWLILDYLLCGAYLLLKVGVKVNVLLRSLDYCSK
jgi:hypothetical protein